MIRNAERKALDTLGLEGEATTAEIKAKFKMLVKQHHPDANGGDRSFEDRLREIITAYNYLKSVGFHRRWTLDIPVARARPDARGGARCPAGRRAHAMRPAQAGYAAQIPPNYLQLWPFRPISIRLSDRNCIW